VLPDGCIDVIWTNDRPPVVAGPMTVPVAPTLTVGSEIVGVRFRPGIAPFLLGVSARELVDRHVPLRDICSGERHRPWAEAAANDVLATKLAAIEAVITTRLASIDGADPIVARAAPWIARNPSGGTAALRDLFGLSERQLRRRFDEAIGYGPKKLQRILRLQRLLWLASQVHATERSLSHLAFAAGYADQAHMTREVVALTQLSPGHLLTASAPHSAVSDLFKTSAR
jgi:AraC-like DNA-binding protein